MTHATLRFHSPTLGMRVQMTALLPESGKPPFATLYLLHGLSDDDSIWTRLSRIESYGWNLPIAIVMPQGFRGFYTNHVEGPAYADYIARDVVGTAERLLPLKAARKARSIAGLSMGGYGALRLALGYPDLFCAGVSHSGAVLYGHEAEQRHESPWKPYELKQIFGKSPRGSDHDLVALAKKRKAEGTLPKLSLDCGTDDFLLEQNRRFHAKLEALKVPHEFTQFPGWHNWDYWDEHVRQTLPFVARAMGVKLNA
jgi:S-formylglutathione hydrolase FrmB